MLKRKIYSDLLKWKNCSDKQCLIVDGARQVGKTYIIEEFGKTYKNYIEINFLKNPDYCEIFAGDLDFETIKKLITLRKKCKIVEGETLLFLDEIQACPRAITALKFLTIDGKIDVIASGSLLGIKYKNKKDEFISYPVGYVQHLEMYSLDFEEFCWANGITEDIIKDLHDNYFITKKEIPLAMHTRFMELFKEYIVVGGMPAVVNNFVSNNDYQKVYALQKAIIADYRNDVILYAPEEDKAKILAVFDSIPSQLAKENKKFQYSIIEKKGSASKFDSAIQWLIDAKIVCKCNNLNIPELPLQGNVKNDVYKIYMCDTGLLMSMMENGSQIEIINGNLGIYKGAIYENIIADIFNKNNIALYYFEKNSELEVDFIVRYNNKVTAVEVKSAENAKSKSLKSLHENYNVDNCIRLSSKNIGNTGYILSLPLYMAIFM